MSRERRHRLSSLRHMTFCSFVFLLYQGARGLIVMTLLHTFLAATFGHCLLLMTSWWNHLCHRYPIPLNHRGEWVEKRELKRLFVVSDDTLRSLNKDELQRRIALPCLLNLINKLWNFHWMKNWFQDECNCWQFLCCAYWYENNVYEESTSYISSRKSYLSFLWIHG